MGCQRSRVWHSLHQSSQFVAEFKATRGRMSKSACEENRKEGQQIRRCWIFARPVTELLKLLALSPAMEAIELAL